MNAVLLCLSLIVIGIALAIAGVIITILDWNQINRMKHFGDIRYLISWI
jgi:hypothetical protein